MKETMTRLGCPHTRMWTLGKHILQIQVEVFYAVAATAENGEDGPYYLAL